PPTLGQLTICLHMRRRPPRSTLLPYTTLFRSTRTSQQGTMDDIELREKIRSRLQERIDNADRIEIEVSGGMVTLSGSARTDEVDRIIDAASTLPNVRSVINRISVQGQPTRSSGMSGI